MATKTRPVDLFDPGAVYTAVEIAETLKATVKQVGRWASEGRFAEGGFIDLPRGRRFYGWALNEFVAQHTGR